MKNRNEIYNKFVDKVQTKSLYSKDAVLNAMKAFSNKEIKDFIECAKYLQQEHSCGEIFKAANAELRRRLMTKK